MQRGGWREEDGGRRMEGEERKKEKIAAVVSIIQDASSPLKSLLHFKAAEEHKARPRCWESFNI